MTMSVLFALVALHSIFQSFRLDLAAARIKESQARIDRLTARVDTLVDKYVIGVKPK